MTLLTAVMTVVYSFGSVQLAPVPPERVLPLEPRWITVPAGWVFEVSPQDGDVICAEQGGERECAMARIGRLPWAGMVVSVAGPARLVVMSCYSGSRRGRSYIQADPSYATGYHVVTHQPPAGRCWWDAWCAIGVGIHGR